MPKIAAIYAETPVALLEGVGGLPHRDDAGLSVAGDIGRRWSSRRDLCGQPGATPGERHLLRPGVRWARRLRGVCTSARVPEQSKAKMELVAEDAHGLSHRIDNALTWMGARPRPPPRRSCLEITVKIGYPDKWRDYSGLDIDDLVGNANVRACSSGTTTSRA